MERKTCKQVNCWAIYQSFMNNRFRRTGVTIPESITEVTNELDPEGSQKLAIESWLGGSNSKRVYEGTWNSRRNQTSGASLITFGHSNPARFQSWENPTAHWMILENITLYCSLVPLSVYGADSNGAFIQFLSIFPSLQSCHFTPPPFSSNFSFTSRRCPLLLFQRNHSQFSPTESTLDLHTSYSFPLSDHQPKAHPIPTPATLVDTQGSTLLITLALIPLSSILVSH